MTRHLAAASADTSVSAVYPGSIGAGGRRRVRGQDLSPPPQLAAIGRAFRQDRLHFAPEREPGRRGDVMPELPDRPDLDQLRRQARELLRAALRNEPSAVARLRTVSDRVTLSAAQLAVARESGYRSWPALKAKVERRRLLTSAATPFSPGGDEQRSLGAPGQRWSMGGATAIVTSAGVLLPEALVAGAGHATLY